MSPTATATDHNHTLLSRLQYTLSQHAHSILELIPIPQQRAKLGQMVLQHWLAATACAACMGLLLATIAAGEEPWFEAETRGWLCHCKQNTHHGMQHVLVHRRVGCLMAHNHEGCKFLQRGHGTQQVSEGGGQHRLLQYVQYTLMLTHHQSICYIRDTKVQWPHCTGQNAMHCTWLL